MSVNETDSPIVLKAIIVTISIAAGYTAAVEIAGYALWSDHAPFYLPPDISTVAGVGLLPGGLASFTLFRFGGPSDWRRTLSSTEARISVSILVTSTAFLAAGGIWGGLLTFHVASSQSIGWSHPLYPHPEFRSWEQVISVDLNTSVASDHTDWYARPNLVLNFKDGRRENFWPHPRLLMGDETNQMRQLAQLLHAHEIPLQVYAAPTRPMYTSEQLLYENVANILREP